MIVMWWFCNAEHCKIKTYLYFRRCSWLTTPGTTAATHDKIDMTITASPKSLEMRHNIYNCHRSQISIISSSEYKLYQSIRWQVLPPAITEAAFRRRKLVWDSRIWRQGDLTGSKSVVTQEVMLIGILYNVYDVMIQFSIWFNQYSLRGMSGALGA